jgi:hypothetical protein
MAPAARGTQRSRSTGKTVYDASMKRKKTVPRRPAPRPRPARKVRKVTPVPKARLGKPAALSPPRDALPAPPPEPAGEHEPVAPLAPPEPVVVSLATPEPAGEHEPVVPLATPELAFAARVPPPTPEPPLPANQRAIFFDVENASQPGRIAQVIEHLAIDRLGCRTEFVAVGNWRVIGHDTARMLARHGAQLVHSAPSTGVRDWSDLRIAVSAGAWLAAARPGDMLEIVSDDRAFDAVGDVAAGLGIAFRRLSSRSLTDTPEETPRQAPEPRRSRERRGRRSPRTGRASVVAAAAEPRRAEPRHHEPAPLPPAGAHTAPHDEIIDIVRELAQRAQNGAVLIDTIERTLKARGFARPPGSPRLVTRLRRIKELSVSPSGMITLGDAPARAEPVAAVVVAAEAPVPEPATGPRRRRSRRGGRGRRRPAPEGQALTS